MKSREKFCGIFLFAALMPWLYCCPLRARCPKGESE